MKKKDESDLKSDLVAAWGKLHPSWPILRHEDVRSCGIPDISITGNGTTLWVEAKLIDENEIFKATGVQIDTCKRLARVGKCVLLFWLPDGSWRIGSPLDTVRERRNRYKCQRYIERGSSDTLVLGLTVMLSRAYRA